ncbi:MAG: type II/IV secretion system protein [Gammaproteobacteria bacterium]|nr:type II/IV secretion system protein [Gammaproteobacteria bacterium]
MNNVMHHHTDEPVSHFIETMLNEANAKLASDIHIEYMEQAYRVRARIDGELYEFTTIPFQFAQRVITRLKILAGLNIAEKRLPQDGRITTGAENHPEIRISTCPTFHGEKIVMRLQHPFNTNVKLHELGLNENQNNLLQTKLRQPQGLILTTGPTGSGKTLTLYSALKFINNSKKNILTVEDPIEIELAGINQVMVHPKIGLDFATILRAFLRQDPDIIMIGEIRDFETAKIALQAAQTGHLVLSTLHANHASEVIDRFKILGIDLLDSLTSLSLIMAQRLIKKLCNHCKVLIPETKEYRAKGCAHCRGGYINRTGIFELMDVSKHVNASSSLQNPSLLLHKIKTETLSLWQSGCEKIKSGETTYQELQRVLGTSYN